MNTPRDESVPLVDVGPYALVVDDDPDARRIMQLMLRGINLPIKEAANGLEALEQIKKNIPALIILDLMMPVMDGFQVASYLRADPRTRYIPVIVVTGMQQGWEMLHLPGIQKVFIKGKYTIQELQELSLKVLAKSGVSISM